MCTLLTNKDKTLSGILKDDIFQKRTCSVSSYGAGCVVAALCTQRPRHVETLMTRFCGQFVTLDPCELLAHLSLISPVIESTGCTVVDRHRARHELDVVVVGKDGW
jgi:hypothetical protein